MQPGDSISPFLAIKCWYFHGGGGVKAPGTRDKTFKTSLMSVGNTRAIRRASQWDPYHWLLLSEDVTPGILL